MLGFCWLADSLRVTRLLPGREHRPRSSTTYKKYQKWAMVAKG